MHDGDIDYSQYDLRELKEALASIKRGQYPENYASLCSAYQRLAGTLPPTSAPEERDVSIELARDQSDSKSDENEHLVPNHIPTSVRVQYVIYSVLLFMYGSYGIWLNDLYILGKRSRGIHLHNVPAWVMYGAMICACAVMLSVVVDHYDKRNNEAKYRRFADLAQNCGWGLFVLSLCIAVFDGK